MEFAIKAEVSETATELFVFSAQKTMYEGEHIAKGDVLFIFSSEGEGQGGQGLVAVGIVASAEANSSGHCFVCAQPTRNPSFQQALRHPLETRRE